MDWASNAPMASGVFLGICGVMILIFSAMMLITQKCKLPKYYAIENYRKTSLLESTLVQ